MSHCIEYKTMVIPTIESTSIVCLFQFNSISWWFRSSSFLLNYWIPMKESLLTLKLLPSLNGNLSFVYLSLFYIPGILYLRHLNPLWMAILVLFFMKEWIVHCRFSLVNCLKMEENSSETSRKNKQSSPRLEKSHPILFFIFVLISLTCFLSVFWTCNNYIILLNYLSICCKLLFRPNSDDVSWRN